MAVFHKLSDHLEAELSRLERKNRSSWLTRPEVFVVCGVLQGILAVRDFKTTVSAILAALVSMYTVVAMLVVKIFGTVAGFFLGKLFRGDAFQLRELWAFWAIDGTAVRMALTEAGQILRYCWPLMLILLLRAWQKWDRMDPDWKQRQDRIGQLRAGVRGEERMKEILMQLPREYDVFQNLYVTHSGETSETDFVVVGPTGVFVVETKNYSGYITGNASNRELIREKHHGPESFYNPVQQVKTHVHRLASRLRGAGFPVWAQGIVAFVGDAEVDVENNTCTPIFSGAELQELCDYICSYPVKVPVSPRHQKRIVELLTKESEHYSRTHKGA